MSLVVSNVNNENCHELFSSSLLASTMVRKSRLLASWHTKHTLASQSQVRMIFSDLFYSTGLSRDTNLYFIQ
jgi:hypothetical protein